jgi:1-deoxy-D-xylulose-5-phosphate synthase
MPLLDAIESPADLKKIPVERLPQLAQEIRERLIAVTSKNGGHLGPNLGVVELTIAMHYVFDTPVDNFLFDVSHQAYVHKMLTGRNRDFDTIRRPSGLNGFMLRTESPHDCYGAGHAGTALSAALGMAVARDLRGGKEHVLALAGDAAFTCGISYEALNNIGSTKRMLIVLNDNEWSIDKNVGAIADYLTKITTHKRYQSLHDRARKWAAALGGSTAVEIGRRLEESAKSLLVPSVIFEEFGVVYYGPVDGHDLPTLIRVFEFLKTQDRPVLLHALTKKGKGFDPALQSQKKFHGLGPYDPETGETKPAGVATYSEVFADTLVKLANRDPRVVGITAAMPNGTQLDRFQAKHPKRYFDVGIAEEHAVLFAAGMATKGIKPYCAIYSTFLQRAFDQVVHDVALQHLPVVFCMDRGGLSGDDGPTHHGLFDISYLRSIPNLIHMDPKNEDELADMMLTALQHDGPSAIRYPRGAVTGAGVKAQPEPIPIGEAEIIRDGEQVAIFSLGNMLPLALETAEKLEAEGFTAAVINARFAKPLDRRTLLNYARMAGLVITFEDHVLSGGFGSAVLEELSAADLNVPVVRIGWPDQFIEHGNVEALRAKYGVSVEAALEQSNPHLARMKKKTIAVSDTDEPARVRFGGF